MEVTLGSLDAVPRGEGRTFVVGERRIAVFHTRQGDIYATQADCPHRGGPLADGLLGGATLVCPLHAWKFDLQTGLASDGKCSLEVYAVRVGRNGQLLLELSGDVAAE